MATGGIQFKVFGDAAAAEKAIVQLEKKYADLENKVRQTSRASKRGTDDGLGGLAAVGRQIGTVIGSYLSLQTVLQGVSGWYRAIREEIEGAAKAEQTFNRGLLSTLALSGDLPVGPQVKGRLQQIQGVTEQQALSAFAGVRGGAPTIGIDRALALTEAVSALAPLLAPLDESGKLTGAAKLTELGGLAAQLSEIAPNKTAGDLVDLALGLQQVAGERVNELTQPAVEKAIRQMMTEGLTLEQALSTTSVGIQQGLSTRQLSSEQGRALIDQNEVARRLGVLTGAQTGDIALEQLGQGLAVSPEVFARQGIFERDEKQDRIAGQRALARQVAGQREVEQAPLAFRGTTQLDVGFREFVENLREAFWGDSGPNAARRNADYQRVLTEESNRTLKEIRDGLKQQRAVNRQAQGEAP